MAQLTEKRLYAVPPALFTADGNESGAISVANAAPFTVKQKVIVSAAGLPPLSLEIKRIPDANTICVGPISGSIELRANLTGYNVSLGANILANEQNRPSVPEQAIERATYQDEPIVARRVFIVDDLGNGIDEANPLPVSIDSAISIGDVSIVQGGNTLTVNPDGSINVIVESGAGGTTVANIFNSISSVPSGVTTLLLTYVVPVGLTAFMFRIEYGGDNIAQFDVQVNTVLVARRRTYFGGQLADTFEFAGTGADGYMLNAGDTVQVYVTHNRPFLGAFEARLQATTST